MKGGSPPKKRHMRSPPPFALHLQYAPTSGSDWNRSCGITPPLPSEGKLAKTAFRRYMPMVGPSDKAASNPGMFISSLLTGFRFNVYSELGGMQRSGIRGHISRTPVRSIRPSTKPRLDIRRLLVPRQMARSQNLSKMSHHHPRSISDLFSLGRAKVKSEGERRKPPRPAASLARNITYAVVNSSPLLCMCNYRKHHKHSPNNAA